MANVKRISLFATLLAFCTCAIAQDDAAQGQKQFEVQCAACHTVKPGVNVGGDVVTHELGGKQYLATTSGVVSGFLGGSGTSSMIVFALH